MAGLRKSRIGHHKTLGRGKGFAKLRENARKINRSRSGPSKRHPYPGKHRAQKVKGTPVRPALNVYGRIDREMREAARKGERGV